MARTGKCNFLAIQRESTYAGTATGTQFFVPVDSPVEAKLNVNTKEIDPINCRIEKGTDSIVVSQSGESSAEGMFRPRSSGISLRALFGAVSTSGSGPYTHTFSVLNSNDPSGNSYELQFGKGNLEALTLAKAKGSVLDTLNINIVQEESINWKASFKGNAPESNSNSDLSLVDEAVVSSKVAKITIPGISASPLDLTSFDIDFSKGVENYFVIGKLDPQENYPSTFECSGSLSLISEDSSFIDAVRSNEKHTLSVFVEDTSIDLGGGVHPKLTINLAQIRMRDIGVGGGKTDKQELTFAFVAEFSNSAGKMVDVELVNDEAAY